MKGWRRIREWLVPTVVIVGLGVLIALGWSHHEIAAPAATSDGTPAPRYGAPTLRGDSLDLASLRGKVVLLNVWATWCPPCRFEMPSLERLYRELAPRGLEVVAVSVDESPGALGGTAAVRPVVADFVSRMGLTFPVLLDPRGHIEDLLAVTGYPTTFIIDRKGVIRDKVVGGRSWDEGALAERVRQLVGD